MYDDSEKAVLEAVLSRPPTPDEKPTLESAWTKLAADPDPTRQAIRDSVAAAVQRWSTQQAATQQMGGAVAQAAQDEAARQAQFGTVSPTPLLRQGPMVETPFFSAPLPMVAKDVAEVAAGAVAPEALLPAAASRLPSGLMMRAARAVGRGLASGTAATGVDASARFLAGDALPSHEQMLARFAINAFPEMAGSMVRELASVPFGAAKLSVRDRLAIEDALTPAAAAGRQADEAVAARDAATRTVESLRGQQIGMAPATSAQGVSEAGTAAELADLTQQAQALPAAVGTTAPISPYRLGFETQNAIARTAATVNRKKNALYDAARQYGESSGQTYPGGPLLADIASLRDDIAAAEQSGLPQTASVTKRIDALLKRIDPTVGRTEEGLVATSADPVPLSYGDLDDLRQYLYPAVKGAFDPRTKKTLDDSRIGSAYNAVKEAMHGMESADPELARLANRADNYLLHNARAMEDVRVRAMREGSQFSGVPFLFETAPDEMVTAMRNLPEDTVLKLRTAAFQQRVNQYINPETGAVDVRKLGAWWTGLTRRQQHALTGGTSLKQVDEIFTRIDRALARRAELEGARPLVVGEAGEVAKRIAQAEEEALQATQLADVAMTEAAKKTVMQRMASDNRALLTKGLLPLAGMGTAYYYFQSGRPDYAMAALLATPLGSRALSTALASRSATNTLYKAMVAAPKTKAAVKYGTQFLGQLAADYYTMRTQLADEESIAPPGAMGAFVANDQPAPVATP